MNENDQLPEKIRKALKDSPTLTPPESFYRSVMDKIASEPRGAGASEKSAPTPPRADAPMRWPKWIAATCVAMLAVFAGREFLDRGRSTAQLSTEIMEQSYSAESRPMKPALAFKKQEPARASELPAPATPAAAPKAIGGRQMVVMNEAMTDKVSSVLRERKKDETKDREVSFEEQNAPKEVDQDKLRRKGWVTQARDNSAGAVATQGSFDYKELRADSLAEKKKTGKISKGLASRLEEESVAASSIEGAGVATSRGYAEDASAVLPKEGLALNWRGNSSGIWESRQVVIRNQQDWNQLWSEHASGQPSPPVDFSRYMVVGVFLGKRPNTGYELEITELKKLPDQLALEYQELLPKEEGRYAARMVQPYALKVIPKTDLHIHFHPLRAKDR